MKRQLFLSAAALALLLLSLQTARAQQQERFPWEEYMARTFGEIIKRNVETIEGRDAAYREKIDMIFSGDLMHSQMRVTYTGATRKIPAGRKEHLDAWAKSLGIKPEVVALFESEMLFLECSNEHWVPVQKQVIPHFEKELKKNDMVTLFTAFTGGRKIDGAWHWVFIVNEFQAYR